MALLDEIDLVLIAGSGGNGAISFRRERYVPRGGPDGGDGGRGGDVIVRATRDVQVLSRLQRQRVVRAGDGGKGGTADRRGRNGKSADVIVPAGTMVWRSNGEEELVADLTEQGMYVVMARGGDGGRGNARFAGPARQAPRIAERGLPGTRCNIRLELRLLADAGLVGLPSAGKSSLLRAMSKAQPKVARYEFTTLEPNLGVVESGYERFVLADVPGLIEGAHRGEGLGIGFLKHLGRTQALVHVVDVARDDPLKDISVVRGELSRFGQHLDEKPWLVALNKIDLAPGKRRKQQVAAELSSRGVEVICVSARTGEGIPELIARMRTLVDKGHAERKAGDVQMEVPVLRMKVVQPLKITRISKGFRVRGDKAERVVAQLDATSAEAQVEIWRRLRRMGVLTARRRAGATEGDSVRIGEAELEWPE